MGAFVVRSRGDAWEVALGLDGACFVYQTRGEAIRRANAAARRRWEDTQHACGVVSIDRHGHEHRVARYGP